MIDYLELLLDEQTQEESRGGLVETDTVFITAQRRRATSQATTESVQEHSVASTEPETVSESISVDVPDIQAKARSSGSFLQGEGVLSRALQRQESWLMPNLSHSWAAGLYRESIDAALSAAVLRQNGSRALTVAETAVSPAAPSVAQLDEVFARDARRYDNGFFMY